MRNPVMALVSLTLSIVTAVSVALIVHPGPAETDPFAGIHFSAADDIPDVPGNDESLGSGFIRYRSDTFAYSLAFPGNWALDDTRDTFHGDIYTDPAQNIVVTVSETTDAFLASPEALLRVGEGIYDSLLDDPAFTLTNFESLTWQQFPTIFSDGILQTENGKYRTREYNILRMDRNGIFNVSITTREGTDTHTEELLQNMLRSLRVEY